MCSYSKSTCSLTRIYIIFPWFEKCQNLLCLSPIIASINNRGKLIFLLSFYVFSLPKQKINKNTINLDQKAIGERLFRKRKQLFLARAMWVLAGGIWFVKAYTVRKYGGFAKRMELFTFILSFLLSSIVEYPK